MSEKKVKEAETVEKTYTKEQIIRSKKYADRKDIVSILLDDNCVYSFKAVDELIERFMKGKVK